MFKIRLSGYLFFFIQSSFWKVIFQIAHNYFKGHLYQPIEIFWQMGYTFSCHVIYRRSSRASFFATSFPLASPWLAKSSKVLPFIITSFTNINLYESFPCVYHLQKLRWNSHALCCLKILHPKKGLNLPIVQRRMMSLLEVELNFLSIHYTIQHQLCHHHPNY